MNTSNTLNTSVPYLGATQRPGPSLGKGPASLQEFDAGFSTENTSDPNQGCCGELNEIDMDQFFQAWGSSEAEFDIDNSGVVDGADLAIFLSMGAQSQTGLVNDVEDNWGEQGASSGDLNGDQVVDGQDLAIALAGGSGEDAAGEDPPAEETPESTPLQDLLDNWGSDSEESDLNGDGTVNGQDLAMLLGGGNLRSELAAEGIPIPQFAQRVMGVMSELGFDQAPPSNIGQLIKGFDLRPIDAKALTINILDLYGKA